MWTFFIISSVCIGISIVLLIKRYAGQGVEWIIKLATAYAWLTSMCIVALVPLDVWTTLNGVMKGRGFVGTLWSVSYWSTQLATWLVLPFYQVYSEAGDFSIKERAKTSVKENALLYGIVGVLGVIGIVMLLITQHIGFSQLANLGVALSNAFGLIAGLLLLGYGLVEIPRQLWKGSDPEISYKWAAHRAGKYAEAVMQARVELRDVITIIYANQRQMRRHDPLQKYMEIVFEHAEKESPIKPSELAHRTVDIDHLRAEDLEYNYDKAGLAALRRRLFWAIWDYRGAHARYASVVEEALHLEEVVKARATGNYVQPTPIRGDKASWWDAPLWVYRTKVRPISNKICAVVLVAASACIVWGEVTIPITKYDLSPFSHIIKGVDKTDGFFVQLVTLLPLVYICASMYYTLFRINAFNYNKLIEHATTGAALMQNGSLMCRFAAPTCWNFYHIIRMTKDICNKGEKCYHTLFDEKMGSLSILPFNLNKYLPVILGVHVAITALDLWDKLLNCCTRARYRFTTDDVEDIYTEKGRLLVRKEADAMSMGYRVGDILATAYVELEFPPVKGLERDLPPGTGVKPTSKGLFSGWFGRKALEPVEAPPHQQPPARDQVVVGGPSTGSAGPRHYTSAAAQAASRWLQGGRGGPTPSTSGAADGGGPASGGTRVIEVENPRTSLLVSQVGNSGSPEPGASTPEGGSAASGLDGIFANLMRSTGGGAATGSGRPAGAANPAPGNDSLLGGTPWRS